MLITSTLITNQNRKLLDCSKLSVVNIKTQKNLRRWKDGIKHLNFYEFLTLARHSVLGFISLLFLPLLPSKPIRVERFMQDENVIEKKSTHFSPSVSLASTKATETQTKEATKRNENEEKKNAKRNYNKPERRKIV